MTPFSLWKIAVVASSIVVSANGILQEANALYPASPVPFKIDVKPEFIALTKLKASLTRFPVDVMQPDWTDGPPVHNATSVRNYWVDEYDWAQVQNELNSKLRQFTTTVTAQPKSKFTDQVPLHFVHHQSNRSNAIPLLFIHGWPGSFMEVAPIVDGLTNPPLQSDPAFHVVAPSIPGFGFSPAPQSPGFGPYAAGEAFNNLMSQLGYNKYVIAGGDVGGFILRVMAGQHPETVVSALCNFWLIQPNATDIQRHQAGLSTPDEAFLINEFWNFEHLGSGYRFEQQTQPLQLGHALSDSPVGFAMWIYTFMHNTVQGYIWSPQEIITWAMMYWIQGPYSGLRWYKEMVNDYILEDGLLINSTSFPFVTQPIAITEYPADIWYRTPLDWAQRGGNVVLRIVHDFGGHFPSTETPQTYLDDLRTFFGNETLSNTTVFK